MAMTVYIPEETSLVIGEQTTWGTTVSLSAGTWHEVQCSGPTITPDLNIISSKADRGYRYADEHDVVYTQNGAMPKLVIPAHPVTMSDLTRYIMWVTQYCSSEGGAALYKRVFELPTSTTYPDFSNSEGLFCSALVKMPVASFHRQINDVICNKLTLSCSPKNLLTAALECVGRGNITTTANLTATPALAAEVYYNFEGMDRFTINIGSGAVSLVPLSWELALNWNILPRGVDGAGNVQNVFLREFTGTFTANVLWDANSRGILDAMVARTDVDVNVGWGNATPGTVAGDLDFAIHGLFNAEAIDRSDSLNCNFTVNICGDEAATEKPLTIITTDGDSGKDYAA